VREEAQRGLGAKVDRSGWQDSTSRASIWEGREGRVWGWGEKGRKVWASGLLRARLGGPQIPPQPETARAQSSLGP